MLSSAAMAVMRRCQSELIDAEVRRIVVQPDYIARIRELGYEPGGSSHTQFTAQVRNEHARWGALIRKQNIKAD